MVADWDRVVELARISLENPAAAAVLRLHQPGDLGHCEECGRLDGNGMRDTTWPCPTVQAIEQVATRPKPIGWPFDATAIAAGDLLLADRPSRRALADDSSASARVEAERSTVREVPDAAPAP